MGFCTGVAVLISTLLPEANGSLSLSHDIDSPGKLFVTVQMRVSNSPSLGGICGPVRETVGGTEKKKKRNQLYILIPINLTKHSQSGQTGTRITHRVTTSTLIISCILESNI